MTNKKLTANQFSFNEKGDLIINNDEIAHISSHMAPERVSEAGGVKITIEV